MASHGVPRPVARLQRTDEARAQELEQIASYRSLVDTIREKVAEQDFSPNLLEKTGALLQKNPEYYTIWNIRRRIYSNEFNNIFRACERGDITTENKTSQVLDIIRLDLGFLFPLLLNFPKCYWIWDHRIWLLGQSSILLPSQQARKIWEEELILVGKMLSRDNRNYHGWGYRRYIVKNLETSILGGSSMAQQEFAYTTKMIGNNLSNFSAWHARTNWIFRILEEGNANSEERKKMLDEELDLIHKALFDPYDQSLWFYHQVLTSAFDPDRSHKSMAPNLTRDERLGYIEREREFLAELLEDADDCKWVYQALVNCAFIEGRLNDRPDSIATMDIIKWLHKLQKLDPLRAGRWSDMESSVS